MPLTIAQATYFRLTAATLAILAAIFLMDIAWFDPLPTTAGRAVNPIFGGIFLILDVPISLKIEIK